MGIHKPIVSYAGSHGNKHGNAVKRGEEYNSPRRVEQRRLVDQMYYEDGMRLYAIAKALDMSLGTCHNIFSQCQNERKAKEVCKLPMPSPIQPQKIKRVHGIITNIIEEPHQATPVGKFLDTDEGKETLARVKQSYKAFLPGRHRHREVLSIADLRG